MAHMAIFIRCTGLCMWCERIASRLSPSSSFSLWADVVSEGESITDMHQRPTNVDALLVWNHQHSIVERLTLIKGSLLMILNHPWSGYCLGSFERQFPEVLAENEVVNPFTVTVKHPHNELLYVWSEGGCLAVVGSLLVARLFCPSWYIC